MSKETRREKFAEADKKINEAKEIFRKVLGELQKVIEDTPKTPENEDEVESLQEAVDAYDYMIDTLVDVGSDIFPED